MRGTVLGYRDGRGVIVTEDDRRFDFAIENWRETQPPVRGAAVDFVERDGRADEIYFSLTAVRAPQPPVPGGQGPAPLPGQGAGPFFAARPGLLFAGLVLLGCLLPFVSVVVVSFNLFNLVSLASLMGNFTLGAGGVQTGLWLFYLLYAVPIMMGWLIFQELRLQASPALRTWSGVVGLVGPFAIIFLASLFVQSGVRASRFGGFGRSARNPDLAGTLLSGISIGWILIIVASIALIAVGRGWSPFGKSPD